MNKDQYTYDRYQRQILLNNFGIEGQKKLQHAKILVIGAGGLGCPALQYLAAAGVGRIGIVDDDTVSLHNLHRQILFSTDDIGKGKADTAAVRLRQMNPEVEIDIHIVRLTNKNALDIIKDYELVIDGTDNFSTRYMINDACVLMAKPLIYGAISQFEGQVAVFNSGENSVNYRDLFPEPPPAGSVLNCAEAGVLGVLPGIIGTMQATEAIKLLMGIGRPLVNRLMTYNSLTNESFVFELSATGQGNTKTPTTEREFEQFDYEWFCGNSSLPVNEIDAAEFDTYLANERDLAIIDVREAGEQPAVEVFSNQQIPLSALNERIDEIIASKVIVFCQSGKRSKQAAELLSVRFRGTKEIFSLQGGILNWINNGKKA